MRYETYDAVVIGGGAAGMAAAVTLSKRGKSVIMFEREPQLGGILLQCIHNGFGLQEFKEELTGCEYAERFTKQVASSSITVKLNTTVLELLQKDDKKVVIACNRNEGILEVESKVIVLAMGCRERNRGNINTPGTRPSGVFTAGLAQRLVNIEGYIPGKEVVIVGSGDIGLIMARRMTWVGAKVKAVIEIQPNPAGLTRNIVQCLNDYSIPLYLSHIVSEIRGKDRVESVCVTPLEEGRPNEDKSFTISCDTVLYSVGLVPDNEITKTIGLSLNPETGGAWVDANLMTKIPGIFSCGNVLHVHDLVDYVSEEAMRCGNFAANYIEEKTLQCPIQLKAGGNVKYVVPNAINLEEPSKMYLRPLIVKNSATLEVRCNNTVLKSIKLRHVQPSEMISYTFDPNKLEAEELMDLNTHNSLEIALS
ncbi:MAG: FAD-dependent oxidoreductase [Spirochaetia bacterium]|nr:FAD-dependent oxidoreductase [Spirochaetia bacterium]